MGSFMVHNTNFQGNVPETHSPTSWLGDKSGMQVLFGRSEIEEWGVCKDFGLFDDALGQGLQEEAGCEHRMTRRSSKGFLI